MAFIGFSRVKETTTGTGTGNLTLAGAYSAKHKAFSDVAANNDTFKYVIEHQTLDEVEWGIGTYVSATPAIARTLVIGSTNGGAAVNFSAGTKHVFISPLGERDGFLDGFQKPQSFVIDIVNTAGTLQHKIVGSTANAEAAAYADKITGASSTLQNTPTVGAGTDFTTGVGIVGSTIVLNTADQDAATYFGTVVVEFYSGNVVRPRPYAGFTSRNVNGTTRDRLEISLTNDISAAAFTINTTNIPSTQSLWVRFTGFLA